MSNRIIAYDTLLPLIHRMFEAFGFTKEQSRQICDVIITADLYGIESHGVQRLMRYAEELFTGMAVVGAKPEIVFETPVSATVDAHDAMGQLAACEANELAIKKAKSSGIGLVTVRNSNHYGIAGYYTGKAVENDLIGVCMTNSEPIVVPTFGKKAMLGTNPIALAMPADPYPFSFDAATSVVPLGKLEVYKKKEAPITEGWALDENGNITDDPVSVIDNILARRCGGLLPVGGAGTDTGGHKGYGYGMICEIFTSVVALGAPSHLSYKGNGRAETSQFFGAIDYGIFGDKEQIKKALSDELRALRESPKAEGSVRIYTHGEKEVLNVERIKREGITVNDRTISEVREICARLGIECNI